MLICLRRMCCGALLWFAVLVPLTASSFEGPFEVRNQFPLFFPLAPPVLEGAGVRDQASVSLTHSSVYVTETSPAWTVNIDLELTEFMIRLKKTVGTWTEVGLDVPVLRPTEGFLDGPLADFHEATGTGDYGRHGRPENAFLYELQYQGRPVIAPVSDRSGFGDVRMTVKHRVNEEGPRVSLMANIELPTGDAETGYGNGSVDAGFAVLVDLDLGTRYRGYGNAGVVVPGDLKGLQTIPMRTYPYAGFGIEAAWWDHVSAIVQAVVAGSPYPETGIRQVDWPSVLLTFGGRYVFGAHRLDLSLTEDPSTAGAPDFMLNIGYSVSF